MITPNDFKILYAFDNDSLGLVEIKRTDLNQDAPVDEVYHWLKFDKENNRLEKLKFKSMDSKEGLEFREFEQAYLEFSDLYARFQYGQEYLATLNTLPPESLPKKIEMAILNHF